MARVQASDTLIPRQVFEVPPAEPNNSAADSGSQGSGVKLECDFGALDSVDKLIGRVQTVREKLSARSTFKRTPKVKVVYKPKIKKTG